MLDDIEGDSIALVFSDQLIEHIHPEDTLHHFKLAHRVKQGGLCVFDTPHKHTGPHDLSKYFSDTPECFDLNEWSYNEIRHLINVAGYTKFQTRWSARSHISHFRYAYFSLCEPMGS